jgi:glycerophosphoryl diester phosphodiesterase
MVSFLKPESCCEEQKLKLPDPFRIIAHRGASGYAPENTMAAFRRAKEMGCTEVETDVGFTKDGKLILFHDKTLERTTNGQGKPEEYTLEELKRLDAGSWWDPANPGRSPQLFWDRDYAGEQLITLEELLDEFGDTFTYHVEIKQPAPGLVSAVLGAIRERGLIDNVFIAAINNDASLQEAIRIEPGIRVASACVARVKEAGPRAIEECAEYGYAMVTLAAFNHTRELVELGQSLGMEVRSSGIGSREHMIEAVDLGCNGMTINWPDWLMEYVAGMK